VSSLLNISASFVSRILGKPRRVHVAWEGWFLWNDWGFAASRRLGEEGNTLLVWRVCLGPIAVYCDREESDGG